MKEFPNRFATRRRANRSEHAFRMHDHLGVSCEWHDSSLTDMQRRRLLRHIWSQFVNGSSRFSRSLFVGQRKPEVLGTNRNSLRSKRESRFRKMLCLAAGETAERASKVKMKNKKLLEISEWLFLAATVLGCGMTLRVAIYQLKVPYQLNYEEGNILNAAVRINQGANPYPAIHPPVYVFNTYGPLVYYLISPLVKHFGPVFTFSRVVVCVAGLIVAALILALLHRTGVSWKFGVSFGLVYLTLPVVQDWVYLLRVDLVGIVLTLAGLGVCWAIPRRWYLAAPLFVAAIFCKYSLKIGRASCRKE